MVSASAITKYALASISDGKRSLGTDTSTGRRRPATIESTPGGQPASGERVGQQPVGQLAQLMVCRPGVLERLGDQLTGAGRIRVEAAQREVERDDRVDETLLRTVVQIAHHAPPSVVTGC